MSVRLRCTTTFGLKWLTTCILAHSAVTDLMPFRPLKCRGGMRTVMITGDHHNTAIAVAKDVGMVRSEENLLLIDTTTQAKPLPSAQPLASGQAANMHEPLMSAKSRVRFDLDSGQAQAGPDSTSVASAMGSLHAGSVGSSNDLLLHRESTSIRANVDPAQVENSSPASSASLSRESASARVHKAGKSFRGSSQKQCVVSDLTAASGNGTDQAAVGLDSSLKGCMQEVSTSALVHDSQSRPLAEQPSISSTAPVDSGSFQEACLPQAGAPLASTLEGVSWVTCWDDHSYSMAQAVTTMAEGHLQCAVTGAAFAHLLQHASGLVIEAIMRNAVVFARMRPQQKGQVMDLLASRGLRLTCQGQSRQLLVSSVITHIASVASNAVTSCYKCCYRCKLHMQRCMSLQQLGSIMIANQHDIVAQAPK